MKYFSFFWFYPINNERRVIEYDANTARNIWVCGTEGMYSHRLSDCIPPMWVIKYHAVISKLYTFDNVIRIKQNKKKKQVDVISYNLHSLFNIIIKERARRLTSCNFRIRECVRLLLILTCNEFIPKTGSCSINVIWSGADRNIIHASLQFIKIYIAAS